MTATENQFIRILRAMVCGDPLPEDFRAEAPEALFALARRHQLEHLTAEALLPAAKAEGREDFAQKLDRARLGAVYRDAHRNAMLEELKEQMTRLDVPYVLLKGVPLRRLYPANWMRSSSDVDVLLHREDLPRVEEAFVPLGYQVGKGCTHHEELYNGGRAIELHWILVEDERYPRACAPLERVWDYLIPGAEGGPTALELRDDMAYYYHLLHMLKHFESSGCGVRSVLDLWLLEHRVSFDADAREKLIGEGGLTRFRDTVRQIAEAWFGEGNLAGVEDVADFILQGGCYGTQERAVTLGREKQGKGYLLKRIFRPLSSMRHSYPILEKWPVLLPACWVIRWFKLLNPKTRRTAMNEIRYVQNYDEAEGEKLRKILLKAGAEEAKWPQR